MSAQCELKRYQKQQESWKYYGYKSFTAYLSSDEDLLILRRYGKSTIRVLLYLQDRISSLEERLTELDLMLSKKDGPILHNGTFREDTREDRKAILKDMHGALREYNEMIIQHTRVRALPCPDERNVRNIRTWFHNHPNAILDEERAYLDSGPDLASILPRNSTPLRRLLLKSSVFRRLKIWEKPPPPSTERDEGTGYWSDERIDACITLVLTALGLFMLVAPIWILAFIPDLVRKLAIITVFIILFQVLLPAISFVKTFESLAATAAYSAVLVVFLQITN